MEGTMEEELNLSDHDVNGVRSPTVRDLVAIAFRHRRLIIISFFGILCGSILAAVLQPSRYEAVMKILVKRERVDPVVTSEVAALPQFALQVTEEERNSEVELLKSRDLLEKVVLACNLQQQRGSEGSRVLAAISTRTGVRTPGKDSQVARAVRSLQKELKVEVVT
jgi:uncharacterized protein involved in exopolysaccharide biosynthesis